MTVETFRSGLLGEILGRSIGVYEYDKRGETLRVSVYVMLVTDAGRLIRLPADQVRITGRSAQGVTLLRLDKGE